MSERTNTNMDNSKNQKSYEEVCKSILECEIKNLKPHKVHWYCELKYLTNNDILSILMKIDTDNIKRHSTSIDYGSVNPTHLLSQEDINLLKQYGREMQSIDVMRANWYILLHFQRPRNLTEGLHTYHNRLKILETVWDGIHHWGR